MKPIATVVIAGANITKYLTLTLSASIPTKGLKSDGTLWITDKSPERKRDILNLVISSGRIGARKEV